LSGVVLVGGRGGLVTNCWRGDANVGEERVFLVDRGPALHGGVPAPGRPDIAEYE